jgi:hypothetical protein
MKKNKYHIFHAWVLLFCFAAGQYMVYAHQHLSNTANVKTAHHNPNTQPKQIVSENCQLCDAMQHNSMALNSQVHFTPVVVSGYHYKFVEYSFTSIALILSAGRSPPLV